MITMTVFRSDTGIYQGFLCSGHAGFARAGKDIVCAAVSVLVINTVNSIEQFVSGQAFDCKQEKDSIRLELIGEPTKETKLLLDSMILGLQAMEQDYQKKYVTVKFKEV